MPRTENPRPVHQPPQLDDDGRLAVVLCVLAVLLFFVAGALAIYLPTGS